MSDIQITNHETVFLVRPLTDEAREWIDENVSDDSSWFGGALAVTPRYINDLINGLESAGLNIA